MASELGQHNLWLKGTLHGWKEEKKQDTKLAIISVAKVWLNIRTRTYKSETWLSYYEGGSQDFVLLLCSSAARITVPPPPHMYVV